MATNTLAAYFILLMWPAAIGMISMIYAGQSRDFLSSIFVLSNQLLSFHLAPGFTPQKRAQGHAAI